MLVGGPGDEAADTNRRLARAPLERRLELGSFYVSLHGGAVEEMSAEFGWIGPPPSTMEQMRERWIAHHRAQGHEPYAARTRENPERWECKCDPDAVWTAVWRILTPEQVRQKFAHLRSSARRAETLRG